MEKIILINGMNCNKCSEKIKNAMYELPQIEEVNISLEEKTANIHLIDNIENDILTNIIHSLGNYSIVDIKDI